MKQFYFLYCGIIYLLFFSEVLYAQVSQQADTVFIRHTDIVPDIDGRPDEAVWNLVEWHSMDNIWMPYNNEPVNLTQEAGLKLWEGEHDFSGRFKVLWSEETNLLYFFVETVDDVFTDGYIYNENPSEGGGYPNFDILELFIDEDCSGGLHVFDGNGSVAGSWGTNAENAFSYHIAINAPQEGQVNRSFFALDIAGTNWGYPSQKIAEYADHFSEFAIRTEGDKYLWEFSLKVYGPNYTDEDRQNARVVLHDGKIMGLTMAYCDNDNPYESPLQRDHFFGSVYVPVEAYNSHWMQADWFGVAKLINTPATSSFIGIEEQLKIETFAANGRLEVHVISQKEGKIELRVINITGREVLKRIDFKTGTEWRKQINIQGLQNGIYLVETIHDNKRSTKKIVVQ